MLKVAWQWSRNSSIINGPLGEPGHTPLYVGLSSAWGSMDGDLCLSPFCRRAPFLETLADINKYIDQRLWRRCIIVQRDSAGNVERDPLVRTLRER
jgi:hypothetical protein